MKRLLYSYLIGLAACFISWSIAGRPGNSRMNNLFAATLGLASWMADAVHARTIGGYVALSAALLSLIFVAAEALRARDSWSRWLGYALWALLAAATLLWFTFPNV